MPHQQESCPKCIAWLTAQNARMRLSFEPWAPRTGCLRPDPHALHASALSLLLCPQPRAFCTPSIDPAQKFIARLSANSAAAVSPATAKKHQYSDSLIPKKHDCRFARIKSRTLPTIQPKPCTTCIARYTPKSAPRTYALSLVRLANCTSTLLMVHCTAQGAACRCALSRKRIASCSSLLA